MFYEVIRAIFRLYVDLAYGPSISGAENLPNKGPLIICANHVHWLDPVVIACYTPRQVHFMAKKELFDIPVFGYALKALGAFPVNRGKPDRAALRWALKVLDNGEVLGVFPEGTRSKTGELMRFFNGAALLACRSGAPIVPAAIRGTYSRGKVCLKIGKPFVLRDFSTNELSEATSIIKGRIEELAS
ncbi:MAG TPA: 1-acyl-sn-glycerol-3-phosphate acyltransferase [Firmicutes bacterium]|nr:1-acyl-sn-glycerol-3-phosphate acyltransferase [Bacillota bacterium]